MSDLEPPETPTDGPPSARRPGSLTSWFHAVRRGLKAMLRSGRRKRSDTAAKALALPPMTRGMQRFSIFMFFLMGAAITAFVVGNPLGLSFLPQGRAPVDNAAVPLATPQDPEQLYQCSMHPEVIESDPGECPICRMDLMPVKQQGATRASRTTRNEGDRDVLGA